MLSKDIHEIISAHHIRSRYTIDNETWEMEQENSYFSEYINDEIVHAVSKEISKLDSFEIKQSKGRYGMEYTNELIVFSPKEFKELLSKIKEHGNY